MRIVWPENILPLLENAGARALNYPSPFYAALRLAPEFARYDEIRAQLVEALAATDIGVRRAAAEILLEVGDPRGILHLTYNALSTHPLLDVQQEGAPDTALLRRADRLTMECSKLLLDDLAWPGALRHVDLWASLPENWVAPRMRALLSKKKTLAIPAAYVLAMHGNDDGRAVLESLVAREEYLDLALIALSHIPDHDTMLALRAYADPKHPTYSKNDEADPAAPRPPDKLLLHAQCRRFMLDYPNLHSVRHTMEHFYLRSTKEPPEMDTANTDNGGEASPVSPPSAAGRVFRVEDDDPGVFVFNSHCSSGALGTGVSAPDLLCEFADASCQAYCAERQRKAVDAWLATVDPQAIEDGSAMRSHAAFLWGLPEADHALLTEEHFPGLKLSYQAEDYQRAAVDWVRAPARHRFASYHPSDS